MRTPSVLAVSYFFAMTMIVASSCKKDDKPEEEIPLTATEVKDIAADPTANDNHYAFYSLETGKAIGGSDSASSKWDIAFRSTTIITNGGASGPGAGGAFVQHATSFDSYAAIPADSVFRTDNAPVYAIPTGSGNGWYNYDFTTNVISPIPGNIIVVRTASGKYAKIEILSYYQGAPATPAAEDVARYYTFRFIYQPDGSKSF